MAKARHEVEDEAKVGAGGKKRLARAKVRRENAGTDKGGRHGSAEPMSDSARAKKRKETVRNVVIAVFAVIMAFSMALPSLSTIFANNRQNNAAAQEASEEEGSTEETEETSEEKTGMEKVDDDYTTTIDPLKEQLEEDSENLAALLGLGDNYMQWAYAASSYATDEDSQEHVNDLFEQAIDYFDQYLELNDSVAVKVNRAICVFYSDSTENGISEMEKLTEDYADNALAWISLGQLYESSYDLEKAQEAYKKAAEVDTDGTYRTYANTRLASMNSSSVENTSDTIQSTTPTDATSLADELKSNSDTSY